MSGASACSMAFFVPTGDHYKQKSLRSKITPDWTPFDKPRFDCDPGAQTIDVSG
jgi:hypothetical protein